MSTATDTISAMVVELADAAILIAAALRDHRVVTSAGWMLAPDPIGNSLGEWLVKNADWEQRLQGGLIPWYRAPQSSALLNKLAIARGDTTITLTPEEHRERINDLIGQCPEPTTELRGVATLGYVAHHNHMDRMEERGERSLFCFTCKRYRYRGERCGVFTTHKALAGKLV